MRVIITGAGRGGTNLLTEMVRVSGLFHMSDVIVEDRLLFSYDTLPENYATKLATENDGMNIENIEKLMNTFQDLHLFFVFRHPVSHCMSKMIRGRPEKEGGDGGTDYAKDATKEGALEWVSVAFNLYYHLIAKYPDRILAVRMEDLVENYDKVCVAVLDYILSYTGKIDNKKRYETLERMTQAYKYNRNMYQRERYGSNIDKSQAKTHENWDSVYDGYFKDEREYITKIQKTLNFICYYFMYDFV